MAEIGIVDTRNILKIIADKSGWNFSDFSITFLKRRLEHILQQQGLQNVETLKRKLEFDSAYFDVFLAEFIPSTTEMFRDPSLWRFLKESVMPELALSATPPKIWIASWDSGEELYSLAILLKEMNLLGKVKIYAADYSDSVTRQVKAGMLDPKKMEVNEANYLRFHGKATFDSYFSTQADGSLRINPELIRDVVFIRQNANFDSSVLGCKLVLFRNQLICMNISQEERVISRLRDCVVAGGFLVVGIKENLEHLPASNAFTNINSAEKVYKRKIG